MRTSAAALIVIAACGGAPARKAPPQTLPALTLPLLAGGTWSSTSAQGKPIVIDVWASWCKPCSKGFPKLDALAARRTDVVVVAITIDEDAAAARDFIAQFPLGVVIAHDAKQTLTGAPLAVSRLPTLLVVDATGVIRHRIEEPRDSDYDRLDELLR